MSGHCAAAGISYSSVQRIWRAHGHQPHRVETFKISRDKNFPAKIRDVVGLRAVQVLQLELDRQIVARFPPLQSPSVADATYSGNILATRGTMTSYST